MTYTSEQAAQMAADTTITRLGGGGRAGGRNGGVGGSDPRFFMDFEWLEWMRDTHPEWTVVQMHDAPEVGIAWRVSLQ